MYHFYVYAYVLWDWTDFLIPCIKKSSQGDGFEPGTSRVSRIITDHPAMEAGESGEAVSLI